MLFCAMDGGLYYFLPVAICIIFYIFRFISSTVEEYIAGGITYIAEYLKMSEALAAVTLLALANGAGDVITAIVACKKNFLKNIKSIILSFFVFFFYSNSF